MSQPRTALLLPILSLLAVVAMPLAAATLDVQVTARDGAAIQDAVVYAIPSKPAALKNKTAVLDQVDRTFVPHVLPVQAGTWVEFPNSDNIRHQVFSVSPARRFQLPLYVGKPARPIQFPESGVVAIGCNIHEQMSAFIVVVPTPYFATAANGRASLGDLPADTYTVKVWYPGMKAEPAAQSVVLGATDKTAITFVGAAK